MQVVTPILLLPGTPLVGAMQTMSAQGGSWVEA